jgi:hypothetical protein
MSGAYAPLMHCRHAVLTFKLQRHTRKILHGPSDDDAWPGQGIIDPNPSGHHADERMVLVARCLSHGRRVAHLRGGRTPAAAQGGQKLQ